MIPALPPVVEFVPEKPLDLGAARIISGYYSGDGVIAPIRDFTLQWHDGGEWKDLLAGVTSNTRPAWSARFPGVRTRRVRLQVTGTKDGISRIWEVEFYKPPPRSP